MTRPRGHEQDNERRRFRLQGRGATACLLGGMWHEKLLIKDNFFREDLLWGLMDAKMAGQSPSRVGESMDLVLTTHSEDPPSA